MLRLKSGEPVFTEPDLHSPAWLKLKKYLDERIETLRAQLENDQDEVQTANTRGRIREVKKLLGIEDDPPKVNEIKRPRPAGY